MSIFCLRVSLCTTFVPGTHGGQKMALGPEFTNSCELPCECCELNPGSLQEHLVL